MVRDARNETRECLKHALEARHLGDQGQDRPGSQAAGQSSEPGQASKGAPRAFASPPVVGRTSRITATPEPRGGSDAAARKRQVARLGPPGWLVGWSAGRLAGWPAACLPARLPAGLVLAG